MIIKNALRNVIRLTKSSIILFLIVFIFAFTAFLTYLINDNIIMQKQLITNDYKPIISILRKTYINENGTFTGSKCLLENDIQFLLNNEFVQGYRYTQKTHINHTKNNFWLYTQKNTLTENADFETYSSGFLDFEISGIISNGSLKNEYELPPNSGYIAVINKNFADEQQLKINDALTFIRNDYEYFNLHGSVDINNKISGEKFDFIVHDINENHSEITYANIYIPMDIAYEIRDKYAKNNGDDPNLINIWSKNYYDLYISLSDIFIQLNSPDEIPKFFDYAIENGFDMQNFDLKADDDIYKSKMFPLNSISSLSSLIFIIFSTAGAVFTGIYIFLNTRSRRFEAGLLLSIGQNKFKTILQFIFENIIICFSSLIFSLISAILINPFLNENYINKINIPHFVLIFIVGLLICFISNVISIIYLSNIKPNELLCSDGR